MTTPNLNVFSSPTPAPAPAATPTTSPATPNTGGSFNNGNALSDQQIQTVHSTLGPPPGGGISAGQAGPGGTAGGAADPWAAYDAKVNAPTDPTKTPYGAAGDSLGEFATGVAKGGLQTLKGAGTMGQAVLDQTAGRVTNAIQGKGFTPSVENNMYNPGSTKGQEATKTLEGEGTAQNVGIGTEHMAEFLLPQAEALKAKGLVGLGTSFLSNAAVRATQTGGDVLDSGIAGILGALAPAGGMVSDALKLTTIKVLSKLSGYDPKVLATALQRTPGAVKAVGEDAEKSGEVLSNVVKSTAAKLSQFAKDAVAKSKATVADLSKRTEGIINTPRMTQYVLNDAKNFIGGITKDLRASNIGVAKDGTLNFERGANMSNIVSGAERNAIQAGYDAIQSITKNVTIKNIDAVMEKLMVLRSKTPSSTPTGPETKAVIGKMMQQVVDFVKSVGNSKLNPVTPELYKKYAQHLEDNLGTRVMIDDAKEMFGGAANLSAKETSAIATRLLTMFNTGKHATMDFAGKVGDTVGEDIKGTTAGTLIKSGSTAVDDVIPKITKPIQGLFTRIGEALPKAVVNNYIKTGDLATLEGHPIIQGLAKTLGASAKVIAQEFAAMLEHK